MGGYGQKKGTAQVGKLSPGEGMQFLCGHLARYLNAQRYWHSSFLASGAKTRCLFVMHTSARSTSAPPSTHRLPRCTYMPFQQASHVSSENTCQKSQLHFRDSSSMHECCKYSSETVTLTKRTATVCKASDRHKPRGMSAAGFVPLPTGHVPQSLVNTESAKAL